LVFALESSGRQFDLMRQFTILALQPSALDQNVFSPDLAVPQGEVNVLKKEVKKKEVKDLDNEYLSSRKQ